MEYKKRREKEREKKGERKRERRIGGPGGERERERDDCLRSMVYRLWCGGSVVGCTESWRNDEGNGADVTGQVRMARKKEPSRKRRRRRKEKGKKDQG